MKTAIVISALFLSGTCHAAAWTNWATPVRVDVVRGEGFMVFGSFANPSGCTVPDQFFVTISHPQYKEMYAMVLTAIATGRQIQGYSAECDPFTWYSVPTTTYNVVSSQVAMNMQ